MGGVEKPGTFGDKFIALNYVMTVYAIWYSAQLFERQWLDPADHLAEAIELGKKAKEKGLYLFGWGKEAATYYRTTAVASAIKEGGDEVRLAVDNFTPGFWSHPAFQSVFNSLYEIIQGGMMKPVALAPSSPLLRRSGRMTSRSCSTRRGRGSRTK